MLEFTIRRDVQLYCILGGDENGHLPAELLEELEIAMETLAKHHEQLIDIIKKLKQDGEEMIANGVTPPAPEAPVYLFN
jgi:hypothetical protein